MTSQSDILALFVPADATKAVSEVALKDRSMIDGLLGDYAERAVYDYGSAMHVRQNGRNEGQPRNDRATDYMLHHSDAAKQGRMEGADESYFLAGPVVITGDRDGELADVPDKQRQHFMGQQETENQAPTEVVEEAPAILIEDFDQAEDETQTFVQDFRQE